MQLLALAAGIAVAAIALSMVVGALWESSQNTRRQNEDRERRENDLRNAPPIVPGLPDDEDDAPV